MSVYEAYLRDRKSYGVLGYRFRDKRPLQEDATEAIQAYNEVWISAVEFFTRERDELIDLPPESTERLFVEGVLGVLHQHEMDAGETTLTADDVRAEAQRVAASLDDMREGASDNLRAYVDRLISGMRELHNRIEPEAISMGADEEAPDEGEGGEEPEAKSLGPEGEPEEEEQEEQPPEPENPESIAQALGLNQ